MTDNKKNIAIIGSGISGISAAYLLSNKHNITLFEKNNYFGGHTRTITINNDKNLDIDTGFIVYNNKCYPDLSNFFKKINISSDDSDMSLTICNKDINLEYGSHSFFHQKKNLTNLKYLKILFDIIRFYKYAKFILKRSDIQNLTLEEYFNSSSFSKDFIKSHIYPIVSSIWSNDIKHVKKFPIKVFIEFFIENNLFNLLSRPKWKTLTHKGKSYINKVLENDKIIKKLNIEILKVERDDFGIKIYSEDKKFIFDEVIISTHADQALKLIKNPSNDEFRLLNTFKYNNSNIFLHNDDKLMPINKKIWSSWNFMGEKNNKFCLSYWMNKLQKLDTNKNYFVTVNPLIDIEKDKIFNFGIIKHPIFNLETIQAQKELIKIQGKNKIWFAGSYFGYGHHEDGIQSSISIANMMNISIPWFRNNSDNRISILY